MRPRECLRYLAGYAVGITLFVMGIPLAIYGISRGVPFAAMDFPDESPFRPVIATAFLAVGTFFVVWSNISLVRDGKGGPTEGFGMAVSPPTRHLVAKGPYRYTRNPMVFGMYTCYLALAIWLGSVSALVLVAVMLFLIVPYLRRSEEKRLVKDFGREYEAYRREVSFIVPLPRKKCQEKKS